MNLKYLSNYNILYHEKKYVPTRKKKDNKGNKIMNLRIEVQNSLKKKKKDDARTHGLQGPLL